MTSSFTFYAAKLLNAVKYMKGPCPVAASGFSWCSTHLGWGCLQKAAMQLGFWALPSDLRSLLDISLFVVEGLSM